MGTRCWLLLLAALCSFAAKPPQDQCGSYAARAHQEVFLHRQHAATRARLKLSAATTQTNQDVGQIAVIDDADGVIDRLNPFTIDNKTISFTPASGGYTLQTSGDSFDSAASAAGALIANFGDDDTRQLALPFSFTFFGATYQQIWVNSNGFLSFTAGDDSANGSFGYFVASLPAIAPLFTDLDPSQSVDGVRILAEPGRFVATWSQVPLYGSSARQTFQVRLYPDGRIQIAYHSMNVADAVVGISAGKQATLPLVDFSTTVAGPFPAGVAEIFSGSNAVDIVSAARKFYQTHDDAYDYLVFYNAENVVAGPGVVAYESTVRSSGKGYGDTIYDYGSEYGSPRSLQAVLNLGPLSQYPPNPNAIVPARAVTGDTPLTILGHETGHLYLALVSVPDPANPAATPPMLGRALVHWAFTFNSDASFLEGNRIQDQGPSVSPRFVTTATVAGYSALDQYLMGFLPPDQVPPGFAVLNSIQNQTRPPQIGVAFDGTRLDIGIADIVKAAGPRIPDSTVAQRRYRFAMVLIVPAGSQPAPSDVAQVDRYRNGFESLFASASGGLASADTSLRRSVALSLAPAAGVAAGVPGTAAIELASPPASALTFTLTAPQGFLSVPAAVTIQAGATRATFPITGKTAGVEEVSATPSDPAYETAVARVQVIASISAIQAIAVSSDPNAVVVRAVDANHLPYSGMHLTATVADQGSVGPASSITDEHGQATFKWVPGASHILTVSIDGGSSVQITPFGRPVVSAAANSASFSPKIAPGSFVALGGANLAGGASGVASVPFPPTLAGVQVLINGSPAQLYSVSDSWINFIAPADLPPGPASIVVQTLNGVSDPLSVSFDAVAPGIFADAATGYGAILIAGTADVTEVHPASPGTYISIYCTGLGSSPNATVQIAGVDAPVSYAGPTIIPGLNQVNAMVANGTPSGTQTLTLKVNDISSNPVKVRISQ